MTIRQFCIGISEAAPTKDNPNRRTAKGARRKYRVLKREQAEARNERTPAHRRSKKRQKVGK